MSVALHGIQWVIYLSKHHNRYITSEHRQTDDNKQIAAHYRNKAILLLNFTINIILQTKPGSQEMHHYTILKVQHLTKTISKTWK